MATESSTTTSLHTLVEPIETKVLEEVKPMEQETVSLPKEVEKEESLETEELPSEAKQISKPDEGTVDKQMERSAVETNDDSVVDVPVINKIEVEKDSICHSHEHSSPEPVVESVTGEPVTQPTVGEVPDKPAVASMVTQSAARPIAEVSDKPAVASVDDTQLEPPKVTDASQSSVEVVEKPKELSDIVSTNESQENKERGLDDLEGLSEKVVEAESPVPEVDVKLQEQRNEEVETSESLKEIRKPPELQEDQPIKESEAVGKDVDVSVPASKESEPESVVPEVEEKPKEQSEVTEQVKSESVLPDIEAKPKVEPEPVVPEVEAKPKVEPDTAVPELDVKPKELCEFAEQVNLEPVVADAESKAKEQSEVAEQVEKVEYVEAIKKPQESSALKEPEGDTVNGIEELTGSKDADKPESEVSKVEAKPEELSAVTQEDEKVKDLDPEVVVKLQEQSVVTEEVEKQKLLDSEVQEKPKEESEVAEQIELKSTDEKTEPAGPDVAGQVEPIGSIKVETVVVEVSLADKVEETTSTKEVQSTREGEPGANPLPDLTEKAVQEDGKKETEGTEVAEVPPKGAEVGIEKGGQEKEDTIRTEDETVDRNVPSEPSQPVKVDDIKNVVSSAEVTERSFEGKITRKGVETVTENDKEDNVRVEIPAFVETSKDARALENLEETITTVTETVKESLDSGSAVKEEEIAKTGEDISVKENVEETVHSEVQDLEPSSKDGADAKTSRDLPTEVPAKSTQKQSNNILTKVKQSLVKAKKAIIGKSPSSKTLTSDKNGDIKVK